MLADVLMAALSNTELPDKIPIKSVHSALSELATEGNYGHLFTSTNFIRGLDVPVSEELETSLFRLCSSGLCTVDNPDFRYLRIMPESRTAMRKVLERHLQESEPNKLTELDELAKAFHVKVRSWMNDEGERLSLRAV